MVRITVSTVVFGAVQTRVFIWVTDCQFLRETALQRPKASPREKQHSDSEAVAVPHLPQCAHWGTFSPGEGLGAPAPLQLL